MQLLADALEQLLPVWRTGHQVGDDPRLVERRILVRADSADASHWLAEECVDRNIDFSLGYQIDERVATASRWCRPDAGTPPSTLTVNVVTAPKSSSSPTW